jgi:hypothetical protein
MRYITICTTRTAHLYPRRTVDVCQQVPVSKAASSQPVIDPLIVERRTYQMSSRPRTVLKEESSNFLVGGELPYLVILNLHNYQHPSVLLQPISPKMKSLSNAIYSKIVCRPCPHTSTDEPHTVWIVGRTETASGVANETVISESMPTSRAA